MSASGRVRLEFGPLVGRLPIVPQLSVALVDVPEFGFDLTLYGGDLTLLPGLESFLSTVLRDFVIRPFVLPGRFVIDLPGGGGEEAALGFDRPKGMLLVRVEEASRVPRVDLFSAADCYVKVGTTGAGGGGKGRRKKRRGRGGGEEEEEESKKEKELGHWSRTRTIPNRNTPAWRQDLRPLLIRDPENELVDFVLMDADEFGADDEVGRATVKVSAVVAALREREEEERERERERRQRIRRRGLARPSPPVSPPEVVADAPFAAAAPAVSRELGDEIGEEGDGGGGVVGRNRAPAAAAVAAPAAADDASSSPSSSVPFAAPPVTDRSRSSANFFVGIPVDDEKTRRALSSSSSSLPEEAEEENGGGNGDGDDDEQIGTASSSSSPSVEALRGSGSIDDPLELWIPCSRLSPSGGAAGSAALEWRRPSRGGAACRGRKAKRLGAAAAREGCLGFLSAFVLSLCPGGKARLYRGCAPADPSEGPPLLRVRLSYHAFSEEEIELAGGGGRGEKKEGEGNDSKRESAAAAAAAAAISPSPPLSPSSRAADILGGGILFVRPRRARNLEPPPLWHRALLRKKAAWVVRVAVAGGVSEEGGPVSKGGTSPTFTEVRKGERERERGGGSVFISVFLSFFRATK